MAVIALIAVMAASASRPAPVTNDTNGTDTGNAITQSMWRVRRGHWNECAAMAWPRRTEGPRGILNVRPVLRMRRDSRGSAARQVVRVHDYLPSKEYS